MAWFRKAKVEARDGALDALQYAAQDRMGVPSGVVVNPESAMRNSAWWACMELIAGVGSSLPLDEFRKIGGDQVEVPLSAIFSDPDPDPSVSAVAWRAQVLRSAVARGNAYAELLGADSGTPTGAVTINPDCADWKFEKAAGGYAWQLYIDGKRRDRWPNGDIWHFPLFLQPGSPVGLSPVQYHRNSIGAALAAQQFGQQFFDKAGLPSVLLQSPVDLTEQQAKDLKTKVIDATRGTRQPLVLPSDIAFTKISISPDDSQFLDTQRYGVEEIARIVLGGFVELIGGAVSGGGALTYVNREQRMADFIALSLAPRYLIPLEAALSALVPRGRYVKHNVDALLRADLQGRFSAYKLNAEIANLMGVAPLTGNDMRRLENRPPIDGADEFRKPAAPADPPITRAEIMALTESRSERPVTITTPDVRVNITNDVPAQEPPVVNVENRVDSPKPDVSVNVAAPVVNITNDVQPTPITNDVRVDVPAQESRTPDVVVNVTNDVPVPSVTVNPNVTAVLQEQPTVKHVKYDNKGRVSEITEEPM